MSSNTQGVFVAEKTGAGHKLIGELTAKSFAGDGPKGHLTALGAAAKALHTASKTKSAPGANPVTDLKAKQAAVTAAEDVVVQDILANACVALGTGCFAAGTKLLTRRGWVPVEALEPGDEVAARDDRDPAGAVEWKPVEDTFRRTGRILHLHFPGGELIRTTPEHPRDDAAFRVGCWSVRTPRDQTGCSALSKLSFTMTGRELVTCTVFHRIPHFALETPQIHAIPRNEC